MDIKGVGDLSVVGEANVSLVNLSGVKADVNKLIDPASKGLDKVFNTLFGKRYANQIRHIALSTAQTDADIKKIEQGIASYNPEEKVLVENSENLKNIIISTIQDEEITNIIQCALCATNFIEEDSDYFEPSKDFINRWRNDAKNISGETLQNIWGKILAEEINSPNTISLRTLNTLKDISKKEAEDFRYLSHYITYHGLFIIPFTSKPRNYLVPHMLLTGANDAGLINMTGFFIHTNTNWETKEASINSKLQECYYLETSSFLFLLPVANTPTQPIFATWLLTSVGKTLYNTIEIEDHPEGEVLNNLLASIQNQAGRTTLTYVYYMDKRGGFDSAPILHEY